MADPWRTSTPARANGAPELWQEPRHAGRAPERHEIGPGGIALLRRDGAAHGAARPAAATTSAAHRARASRGGVAAAAVCFGLLVAAIVRCAWVGDDAFITLRTVENLLAGHGLVWNAGERVQTFTHPLWLLLLAPARWLTGDGYTAAIALGLSASVLAAALLVARAGRTGAVVVALVLLGSRAFVEYATSGLETSLVFVLVAWLAAAVAAPVDPARRLSHAALATGLLATTRIDLAVLCAPALLAAAHGVPPASALRRIALGMAPFAAWLAFATVYYGTPLPITAHAKVLHAIPFGEVVEQGVHFLAYAVRHDPVTVAVLAFGGALGIAGVVPRARALALGAWAYCGYVVLVGGDFMGTRFLAPPFVVAAAIVATWARGIEPRARLLVAAAAVALHVLPGPPGWWSAPGADRASHEPYRGITDERAFYYATYGLLSPTRDVPVANAGTAALAAAGRTQPFVVPTGFVGRFGYVAGPGVYVCDSWLCDPLLMRLPGHRELMPQPAHGLRWRVGHIARRIPEGYLETLAHGVNALHDGGLARAYDTLRTMLRAPVLAPERLAALWSWWRGDHREDLAAFAAGEYVDPPRLRVDARELEPALPAGTLWFDEPRVRLVMHGGLAVRLPRSAPARTLRLWLHGGPRYTLRFRANGADAGVVAVDCSQQDWLLGLQPHTVAVPAAATPFDELWIDAPTDSERVAAIGGIERQP